MTSSIPQFQSTFLFPVRSTTSSRIVTSSITKVQEALHDASLIIKLDPLVVECDHHKGNVALWTVVNRIRLFGLAFCLKYHAKFHQTAEGVVIAVTMKSMKMRNTWKAKSVATGTEIEMEVQSQAFFLVMFLMSGAIRKNHDTILNRIVARLEEDQEKFSDNSSLPPSS